MAGSIKIQQGTTPSTPQAGFSTLWVKSSDGEFYYTKPDGVTKSLVGATGPTGSQGAQGIQGATGIGLGLNAKNIGLTGGQFTFVGSPDFIVYRDIVFDAPFASTNYSIDVQWTSAATLGASYWADLSVPGANPVVLSNKTTSGFRLEFQGIAAGTFTTDAVVYVQCIALGETSVSYYGNFYDTTIQTNAGATAANTITYNTTDLSSGVSIVSNSRITIANAGIYNIEFSAQLQKTSGGDDYVDIWLSKNGSNVANTNTTVHLVSNPGYGVAAWNFLVQANAGDYYELKWHSSDTTMELHAAAAGTDPIRPATPSIILSVSQISS